MNTSPSASGSRRSESAANWPPANYTVPKVYTTDERWIVVIAILLIPPTLLSTVPDIKSGTAVLTVWTGYLGQAGLVDYPKLYIGLVIGGLVAWIGGTSITIIAVHEGIHYVTGRLCGLNPAFEWTTHLGAPNPSIVAYYQGIQRWENILMLTSPFVGLCLACGLVMWTTNGVLAATAAIMFAVNAVASAMDLYNAGRLVRFPHGTLFANFDTKEGLRTEYTVPQSREY